MFVCLQVQFDEREDTKVCTIVINDDHVFENIESFTVELSMPVYALLGQVTRAKVNINDTEDEPTLQFDKQTYHINESSGFIFVPIERKGAFYSLFALSDKQFFILYHLNILIQYLLQNYVLISKECAMD